MSAQPTEAIEVFFAYSYKDKNYRDELATHLTMLEQQGVITAWHDREIRAGTEWQNEIDEHINTARILLFLVSPDFMASGYCDRNEFKQAMERYEAREVYIIPVLLRTADWIRSPLGRFQALPKDAKPVTQWADRDEALLKLCDRT